MFFTRILRAANIRIFGKKSKVVAQAYERADAPRHIRPVQIEPQRAEKRVIAILQANAAIDHNAAGEHLLE